MRCGRELAARFDSYTFDSFAKGLIDRFHSALPTWCRPSSDYRVLDKLNERQAIDFIRQIPSSDIGLTTAQIHSLSAKAVWNALVGRPLPADGKWVNASDEERAAAALWTHLLGNGHCSALGFPMLSRMASLLLRANPLITSALRKSYRFVFLDEFQDTTAIQYGLIKVAFMDSGAVITAVGDDKQRIMGWAGALQGVFEKFVDDFEAESVPLTRNYRSTENLVATQSVIAKALDPDAVEAESMVENAGGVDECRVLAFDDDAAEARKLASMIHIWVDRDDLSPRDICVLCRMKPPVYSEALRDALAAVGIRSRIENEMQDLLSEPLAECLLDILKLACREHEPEAWGRTVALLDELIADSSEEAMRRVVDSLLEFLAEARARLAGKSSSQEDIESILQEIMRFVGEADFKAANPQYLQGEWYAVLIKQLTNALTDARNGRDWPETIDEVEGVDSVPIMTTHKSKGLEYHTVIFVGLEDDAHFDFANKPKDETCGFFVALSRAMRRVIFTFSGARPKRLGGNKAEQSRDSLAPLYELLENAGVDVEDGASAEA
jgi:superfamily I DNA/RNA helicase